MLATLTPSLATTPPPLLQVLILEVNLVILGIARNPLNLISDLIYGRTNAKTAGVKITVTKNHT